MRYLIMQSMTPVSQKDVLTDVYNQNDKKYIYLYNKRVITLISVNIVPLWDIYGGWRPSISHLGKNLPKSVR